MCLKSKLFQASIFVSFQQVKLKIIYSMCNESTLHVSLYLLQISLTGNENPKSKHWKKVK